MASKHLQPGEEENYLLPVMLLNMEQHLKMDMNPIGGAEHRYEFKQWFYLLV